MFLFETLSSHRFQNTMLLVFILPYRQLFLPSTSASFYFPRSLKDGRNLGLRPLTFFRLIPLLNSFSHITQRYYTLITFKFIFTNTQVYMYIYIHKYTCVHRFACVHVCAHAHTCIWSGLLSSTPD